MEVCNEMQKLRNWLDEKQIEWEDLSQQPEEQCKDLWICRTRFKYSGKHWSVINGFGSYGGFNSLHKHNEGLLEIWDMEDEPKGWMTAEEAIAIIKGEKICKLPF